MKLNNAEQIAAFDILSNVLKCLTATQRKEAVQMMKRIAVRNGLAKALDFETRRVEEVKEWVEYLVSKENKSENEVVPVPSSPVVCNYCEDSTAVPTSLGTPVTLHPAEALAIADSCEVAHTEPSGCFMWLKKKLSKLFKRKPKVPVASSKIQSPTYPVHQVIQTGLMLPIESRMQPVAVVQSPVSSLLAVSVASASRSEAAVSSKGSDASAKVGEEGVAFISGDFMISRRFSLETLETTSIADDPPSPTSSAPIPPHVISKLPIMAQRLRKKFSKKPLVTVS